MSIIYKLDGIDFKNYSIYVSEGKGILDDPKPKKRFSRSWDNQHGESIDLRERFVEPREITLECFVKSSSNAALIIKTQAIRALFAASGLRRLSIQVDTAQPLIFDVYLKDQITYKKKWRSGSNVATFTLKLVDPAPVKRVIAFTLSVNKVVGLDFISSEPYRIFWGDGSYTDHVTGGVSHTYSSFGKYYVAVCGNIDKVNFNVEDADAFDVIWNLQ
jgi:hypothetical protein